MFILLGEGTRDVSERSEQLEAAVERGKRSSQVTSNDAGPLRQSPFKKGSARSSESRSSSEAPF